MFRGASTKLDLFKRRPDLVDAGRYVIKTDVDPDVFALFMTRLWDGDSNVEVTPENADQLRALCDELGFSGFNEELRAIQARGGSKAWKDLVVVRSRVDRHDVLIEQLQRRVLELENQLSGIAQKVDNPADFMADQLHQFNAMNERFYEHIEPVVSMLQALYDDVMPSAEEQQHAMVSQRSHQAAAPVHATKGPLAHPRHKVITPVVAANAPQRASVPGHLGLPTAEEVSRLKDAERHGNPNKQKIAVASSMGQIERVQPLKIDAIDPLNGIIAHLTRECRGNVHAKGIVKVITNNKNETAKNAADIGTNSGFRSADLPNQWISYDFSRWRVSPTSYSIRTVDRFYPKSWVFEVSHDGSEGSWEVVDRRDNNEELIGYFVTTNFAISDPPRGSFRFVRLRQTGENHSGSYCLALTSLEVFGTLSSQ